MDLARKLALCAALMTASARHVVAAQNPPAAPPPVAPVTPAASLATGVRYHVDATKLSPGEYVYQTTLERDVSTTVLGTRTVSVAQATYAGLPVWQLTETRAGDGVPAADTVYADLGDLHPIHWSSMLGRARIALEFRGDSVYGALSGPSTRRSIVTGVPQGTLVSAGMLESELRLLPLQPAWEDSATTLAITLGDNTLLPTRIAVIGEDHVRVPAGQFDCWVVAVHAGDTARGLYWVTKQDPIVVRSALDVPTMGGAQLVSSLTRITR